MSPQYTIESEGYTSGYESTGGRLYYPTIYIGKGAYALARWLETPDKSNTKVVLSPADLQYIDYSEVKTKARFLKAIYPEHEVSLTRYSKNWRLVVPLVPGVSYDRLRFADAASQIEVFICLTRAIKHAHRVGYTIVDLTEKNIYYDDRTRKAYLIDGGLSAKTGEALNPGVFRCATPSIVEATRSNANYCQIAPECWSISTVIASRAMDVYSFGSMLARGAEILDERVKSLVSQCMRTHPKHRPTFDALEVSLMGMLFEIKKSNWEKKRQARVRTIVYQLERMFLTSRANTHALDCYMIDFIFQLFIKCTDVNQTIQCEAHTLLKAMMPYAKSAKVQDSILSWLFGRLNALVINMPQINTCIPCSFWGSNERLAPQAIVDVALDVLPIVYYALSPAHQSQLDTWTGECSSHPLQLKIFDVLTYHHHESFPVSTLFACEPLGINKYAYDLTLFGAGYKEQRNLMMHSLDALADEQQETRQQGVYVLSFLLLNNLALSHPMRTYLEMNLNQTIEGYAFQFILDCYVAFFETDAENTLAARRRSTIEVNSSNSSVL
jgi:hypothetical protein